MKAHETNGTPQTVRDAARDYRARRGLVTVPVAYRGKSAEVGGKGWNQIKFDEWDLDKLFPPSVLRNIGGLWGRPSATAAGAPVDVDLDQPEAVTAADHLLPDTGSVYGRTTARRSHRLFWVADPHDGAPTFTDLDGSMLVELRGTGVQSVLPHSVHESGEPITWDVDGEPAVVPIAELRAAVGAVAAATILARHWPTKGSRDEAAKASPAGWSVPGGRRTGSRRSSWPSPTRPATRRPASGSTTRPAGPRPRSTTASTPPAGRPWPGC